jgi:hypothetical protein
MLYREIIAVCSQIHTKHINTLCGQNVELRSVTGDAYSDHWDLRVSSEYLSKPPEILGFYSAEVF